MVVEVMVVVVMSVCSGSDGVSGSDSGGCNVSTW